MGSPRRFKNKYDAPKKLWEKNRIVEGKTLRCEYGLKNSREIWIAAAELKKYRREARRLLSLMEEERKGDMEKIINRLNKYGILGKTAGLEDILSLDLKAILERRLQTRVLRKGLTRTTRQARQLIAHGFISIGDRVITVPSYMVTEEEDSRMRLCKPIDLNVESAEDEEETAKSEKKEEKPVEKPKEEKPEPKKEEKVEKKVESKKEEKKAEKPKEEKPAEKKAEPKKEVKEKPKEVKAEKKEDRQNSKKGVLASTKQGAVLSEKKAPKKE